MYLQTRVRKKTTIICCDLNATTNGCPGSRAVQNAEVGFSEDTSSLPAQSLEKIITDPAILKHVLPGAIGWMIKPVADLPVWSYSFDSACIKDYP